MYAELLEMVSDSSGVWDGAAADGLPADLESGWVALAPVPKGKRCLAVTQSAADCTRCLLFYPCEQLQNVSQALVTRHYARALSAK